VFGFGVYRVFVHSCVYIYTYYIVAGYIEFVMKKSKGFHCRSEQVILYYIDALKAVLRTRSIEIICVQRDLI